MGRRVMYPAEVIEAVARALIRTHVHHGHRLESPIPSGARRLTLYGKGEFQDYVWLIQPDGQIEPLGETPDFTSSFVEGESLDPWAGVEFLVSREASIYMSEATFDAIRERGRAEVASYVIDEVREGRETDELVNLFQSDMLAVRGLFAGRAAIVALDVSYLRRRRIETDEEIIALVRSQIYEALLGRGVR